MKVDLNSPLAQRVYKLKLDNVVSVISGDYKTARNSRKELAKIGVDNFELITQVKNPVEINFALFSKAFWNDLKFRLAEMFRIKTPEEQKFADMIKAYQNNKKRLTEIV